VGRVEVDLAGDARSGHGWEDGGSREARLGRDKNADLAKRSASRTATKRIIEAQ
jgi:hypothetical protein